MARSRSVLLAILATGIIIGLTRVPIPTAARNTNPEIATGALVQVTVSALHSTRSWNADNPQSGEFDLPLVYVRSNRAPTLHSSRTLTIAITGLDQPELRLEAVSHHVNVATGQQHTAALNSPALQGPCTTEHPCRVQWMLEENTPSDFYYLRVTDTQGTALWQDFERPAFVALDTWRVVMPGTERPYDVQITYATLFPFARGAGDMENRLAPDAVTDFVDQTFVPIIRETWQTQVEAWGFGTDMHPQWDDDNVVDIIVTDPPYALFGETGTYALLTDKDGQPYAKRSIWWFSSNNAFQAYDTLASAYRAVFAHEFFHLMQWNTLLHTGHPANLWISWIEAQGRFASTVQYPQLELSRQHLVINESAYTSGANRFLSEHLNRSYGEIEANRSFKYDGALYWRFLYEQYGGMDIIRAALDEMTRHYTPGDVGAIQRAMDAALARVDGPFRNYEESLIAYARANYALRLQNGRCESPEATQCDGRHYDPEAIYHAPALEAELDFRGEHATYGGDIPSSFGMDFVEVKLPRGVHGQPLSIMIKNESDVARFNVQVWQLGPGYAGPTALTTAPAIMLPQPDGTHTYSIAQIDTLAYNRLGVIITRVDAAEDIEPQGRYKIVLYRDGE
jgi:hypothetical protein